MKFDFTPEEAQPVARAISRRFRKQQATVVVERAAWPDAPYRTTLVASRARLHTLVEAQGTLSYSAGLKALAQWIAAGRRYAELYIATSHDAELQVGVFEEMKRDGVGLLLVDAEGNVSTSQPARNPALQVTPEPTLTYSTCAAEVRAAVRKFNEVDRKDGLRDMCELVERLTGELGVRAAKKSWIKTPEAQFVSKDWSSKINELARPEICSPGRSPLLGQTLKDDMQSFRGARNLLDHPPRTRRDNVKRQRQFAERMMQGPRLVAELASLKRKVR